MAMKSMRWRIALVVLWLSLLFNIERFDFEKGTNVNLASSFYILAATATALFLLVPMGRRVMYVLGGGIFAAYIILKLASPAPVFQGYHKYLTVTEVVALLVTMGLAWLVNRGLQDFEHAVEAISLPKGRSGVLEYNQMQVRDAQAALIKRYVQVQFGVFLTKHTRETDAVAHHTEDGHFLLLAPETPGDQVEILLTRLSHQVEENLGLRFRYHIADFPKTALTSEELVHKATDKLRRETETSTDRRAQSEPTVATGTADT